MMHVTQLRLIMVNGHKKLEFHNRLQRAEKYIQMRLPL